MEHGDTMVWRTSMSRTNTPRTTPQRKHRCGPVDTKCVKNAKEGVKGTTHAYTSVQTRTPPMKQ